MKRYIGTFRIQSFNLEEKFRVMKIMRNIINQFETFEHKDTCHWIGPYFHHHDYAVITYEKSKCIYKLFYTCPLWPSEQI